ncbi:MAG: coproporphyrinogen III oxidase, partial [Paracoccaceae bacterium]
KPDDGMAIAARRGNLRRNFQGYTDDTAPVLLGLGASSISRFPQGFAQNNSSTGLYTGAIRDGRFATVRGHRFQGEDCARSRMIELLMCSFCVSVADLRGLGVTDARLKTILAETAARFAGVTTFANGVLTILPDARPLTRVIAQSLDAYDQTKAQHSSAI